MYWSRGDDPAEERGSDMCWPATHPSRHVVMFCLGALSQGSNKQEYSYII
jgi:hypothetical protein